MPPIGLAENEPLASSPGSEGIAEALTILVATFQVHDAYQDSLRERFALVPQDDRKTAQKHQKVLLAQPSLPILTIIWKESPWVSASSIDALRMSKAFSDESPINCHNLANQLAADISDVERQQKRVQSVVAAAEVYGYIERPINCRTRARALIGTEILHALMVRLGAQARGLFFSALGNMPEPFK